MADETPQPDPQPEAPAYVPFTPPREAGEWILGPNGPTRKE